MVIIDAKNKILGRLSAYAAKQALLGNNVEVINCEEAVVSGTKANILANYIRRIDRKAPNKGPYLYRRCDFFVRRTIRGMLPFQQSRGQTAFRLVKCHVGVPEIFKDEKAVNLEHADAKKFKLVDYIKVKEICRAIGGKI